MEEGTKLLVIYNDGERPRSKVLIFLRRDGKLLVFQSVETNRIEYIPEDSIIRMEEKGDEQATNNL